MDAYYIVALILSVIAGAWAAYTRAFWGLIVSLAVVFVCLGLLKVFH
jgi:hypothetical protein